MYFRGSFFVCWLKILPELLNFTQAFANLHEERRKSFFDLETIGDNVHPLTPEKKPNQKQSKNNNHVFLSIFSTITYVCQFFQQSRISVNLFAYHVFVCPKLWT